MGLRRLLLLGPLLALLAGCDRPTPPATEPVCRTGPDDGPPLADRGIGGTGAVPNGPALADRGIGGTGIIGVVTGFASICVNQREIDYALDTAVTVDRERQPAAKLRAGQIVTIDAAPAGNGLWARSVVARHVVSGPVTASDQAAGRLTVAGQPVSLSAATRGWRAPPVGAWVAVSGFLAPEPAAPIVATRLDPREPGMVGIDGWLLPGADGRPTLGGLRLSGDAAASALLGQAVSVTGRLAGDGLVVDTLAAVPNRPFGTDVDTVILGGLIVAGPGGLRVGPAVTVEASADQQAPFREPALGIVEARVSADGRFMANRVRTDSLGGANAGAASKPGVEATPAPAPPSKAAPGTPGPGPGGRSGKSPGGGGGGGNGPGR